MAEEEYRSTLIHALPILTSLTIGILCAFLIMQSGTDLASLVNFPETGFEAVFAATAFVIAVAFGATAIFFLLKHGVYRLIRLLLGFAFSILTFSLVVLYSELVFLIADFWISLPLILFFAFLVTTFAVWEIFVKSDGFAVPMVLVLGGAAGTLLGASIPTISAVTILLLLAVYDTFSVFHGPVGKIAAKGLEYLPGVSFSFRNIQVGLGDLTFYSMLVSHMFLRFGLVACAASASGVMLGSFLSIKMVERKGIFPGLPFPIVLGLAAGFLASIMT